MPISADELLEQLRRLIARGGDADARGESERLLAAIWGVGLGGLHIQRLLDREIPDEVAVAARAGARLRGRRVPLQHIVGTAPFRDIELAVGPGVFVPRPETELLIEHALAGAIPGGPRRRVRRAIDLGAGSGAIAISLARAHPDAQVIAFEASAAAWPWLRRNTRQWAPEVELRFGDWAEQLEMALGDGEVDLLVSNPPYVPELARPTDPEVYLHDPSMALYSGRDGLDEIRRIAAHAVPRLSPGGEVFLEHAEGQGARIRALLESAGMHLARTLPDLSGRERFTSAVAGPARARAAGVGRDT